MKKYNIHFLIIIILFTVTQSGCGSMFAHLFGSDHLKDKKYKFLMFDEDNSRILYGGYVEIKSLDDVKFSGEFRIIDMFAESIPVGSGKVDGTQNEDKDKADMYFSSSLTQEKIEIKLDRTWNLLEGYWKYKTIGGKFIAFENN
jgi:uncharacterized protein YceK